jgi:hypothetical protein
MTKPKTKDTDQTAGKAAFLELEPRLRAIPTTAIAYPNIDAAQAATAAIALARFANEPEMRKRFAALVDFHIDCVVDVEKAGWALFFLQAQVKTADATANGTRVPVATVDGASRLRARMLKLLTYYFDTDPTLAAEPVDIRAGSGYLDLATDLMRLAALHEENKDILKADPLNYRAADAKDARAAAHEILGALGEETREAWADLRNRAYTLLVDRQLYDLYPGPALLAARPLPRARAQVLAHHPRPARPP